MGQAPQALFLAAFLRCAASPAALRLRDGSAPRPLPASSPAVPSVSDGCRLPRRLLPLATSVEACRTSRPLGCLAGSWAAASAGAWAGAAAAAATASCCLCSSSCALPPPSAAASRATNCLQAATASPPSQRARAAPAGCSWLAAAARRAATPGADVWRRGGVGSAGACWSRSAPSGSWTSCKAMAPSTASADAPAFLPERGPACPPDSTASSSSRCCRSSAWYCSCRRLLSSSRRSSALQQGRQTLPTHSYLSDRHHLPACATPASTRSKRRA